MVFRVFTCEDKQREITNASKVRKAGIMCALYRWKINREYALTGFMPVPTLDIWWSMSAETDCEEFEERGTESISLDETTELVKWHSPT